MNILKSVLALIVCAFVTADVKRDLGFAGVGSYNGVPGAHSNRFVGEFTNQGNKFFDGGSSAGVFQVGASGFGKGAIGHNGFGNIGHNNFGDNQDFGGFNEGFQAPLFTPVLVQPAKGVTFDGGWKGLDFDQGSIEQGHIMANTAFRGGHHRAVIPVHENTNDISPVTTNQMKVHSGFVGFQSPNFGTFGHGTFGATPNKGFGLPQAFDNNFRHTQTFSAPVVPIFNPTFNKETVFANTRPHFQQNQHFQGLTNNIHSDLNIQNSQTGYNGHGNSFSHGAQSGAQFGSYGGHSSSLSNQNDHTSVTGHGHDSNSHGHVGNFGSSHVQGDSGAKYVTPSVSHSSGHGHNSHSAGNNIADGHGTNGHGAGHSHEKATSFQSFVIHTYKPVPVYAKLEHKHDGYSGHIEGSQRQGKKNQGDH